MRGVSEVLGEILLLAIVVLLVAAFSSELGTLIPSPKEHPEANFVLTLKGSNYTIVHTSGDPLPLWDTKITVYNGSLIRLNSTKLVNDLNGNGYWDFGEWANLSRRYGRRLVISIVVGDYVVCRIHT